MRREPVLVCLAMTMSVVAASCSRGEKEREQRTQVRAQRESLVRESEIVQRAATPRDSGRIIYDPPPSLSAENLARTRASIVGLDKPLQAGDSARQSTSRAP